MEFPGISGDDIEWLQEQFVKCIKVNFTQTCQPKRRYFGLKDDISD